ncbi:MAG: efflux transporter outer membrane subunit [Planctomycetes bacterium]|nr:efflux transporter outer membrane subunit [Planctomycetota bacterium]
MHIRMILVLSAAVLTVGGCMLGPDYTRPVTPVDGIEGYSTTPSQWTGAEKLDPSQTWWKSFKDPVIDKYVQKALSNNFDLKAAAARVLEAEALLAQSHGRRLPDVQYSGVRSRSKISFTSPFGGRESFINKTYAQDISINYMVDFFGKLKRLERASFAELLATEANRTALTHSIIAQVVRARVRVATQQRLLATAQANIKSRTNTLKVVERRYKSGLTSPLDVYQAKENLATAKSLEPILKESLALAQHSLEVLIGAAAGTTEIVPDTLAELPELTAVPVGIPAALLDRRPDLRASEFLLKASNERIGASIAEMYPDMTLTGVGGYRADSFKDVFDIENQVFSFIMSIAAPIYKGGRLKAQVKAAKARTEQAAANYSGLVLKALQEVEDSLSSQEYLAESALHQKERLAEALRGEKLANERYSQGLEILLVVLDTERRRRLAEDQYILTKGLLYNARINLFLALGGDWKTDQETADKENVIGAGVNNE